MRKTTPSAGLLGCLGALALMSSGCALVRNGLAGEPSTPGDAGIDQDVGLDRDAGVDPDSALEDAGALDDAHAPDAFELDASSSSTDAFVPPDVSGLADAGPLRDAFALDVGCYRLPYCEGSVLVSCAMGTEVRQDCAADGRLCQGIPVPTCITPICTPSQARCDGDTLYQCDATGTIETATACPMAGLCENEACTAMPTCNEVLPEIVGTGSLRRDLCGKGDDHDASCADADGPDLMVAIRITEPGSYTLELRDDADLVAIDTVLSLLRVCGDPSSERACSDDFDGEPRESRITMMLQPGTYYAVLDSVDRLGWFCGQVQLTVTRS